MDLPALAVEDHCSGGAAHLLEVSRDGGKAVQNHFVQIELVIGNDVDILSNLKVLCLDAACKGGEAGVELGVDDQIGLARIYVLRCLCHEVYRDTVLHAETVHTLADHRTVKAGCKGYHLQA